MLLAVSGKYRLFVYKYSLCTMSANANGQRGWTDTVGGKVGKRVFDNPVLQTVKGNDSHPSAGVKAVHGLAQISVKTGQFLVYFYA